MARDFEAGSTEYLEVEQPVVSAAPFTVSCWFNVESALGTDMAFWWCGDKGVTNAFWGLRANDLASGQNVRFRISSGLGSTDVETSTTYTVGQWHHACAVEASTTDHRAFLDGGGKATSPNLNGGGAAGSDRTAIGRFADSTPTVYMDGRIAHVAVWDVALSDQEVASLANGASPLAIRRDNLIAYWPIGGLGPEPDVVGGLDMTVFGSVQSEEPPIPRSVVAPG